MEPATRKRLHRRESVRAWRYLTCSCHRRLPLFTEKWVKDAFVEGLAAARERYRFLLLAWVVMPEHFHVVLATSEANRGGVTVPRILHGLKTPLAQRVLREWRVGRSQWIERTRDGDGKGRFWQAGGGFDRNVRDEDELWKEVRYIHWNPVKRGLVTDPLDWKWSSARWWAGQRDGEVPIDWPARWE